MDHRALVTVIFMTVILVTIIGELMKGF